MTPIKNNQKPQNPVLSFRVPPEIARQLDELCKRYGMDRTQVLMMLISREHARHNP